jgi:hypothetical protein
MSRYFKALRHSGGIAKIGPLPSTEKPMAALGSSSEDSVAVDAFMAALQHPAKPLIEALRAAVTGADARIHEGVKWNAPSFRTTEYFGTTHLRAKQGVGLILHFGAKKNAISAMGVAIPDPAGLLHWLGKDRAQIVFADLADLHARQPALQALLREWITHVA